MCGYVIPNQSLELPTVDDKEEQENWKKYAGEIELYAEGLEEKNKDLKAENQKLLEKNKDLGKQLSNNSVYDKSLEDLEVENRKLKNDLIGMEKRALKAEKVANLNSPEASIIELFTAMNNLSNKLSTSSKLIENKAEKELKDKQKDKRNFTETNWKLKKII
jgi:hypothetical protein